MNFDEVLLGWNVIGALIWKNLLTNKKRNKTKR